MKTENKKNNSQGLKKHTDQDWWNEISEAEKASIDRGLQQLKDGKGILHEEVIKRLRFIGIRI